MTATVSNTFKLNITATTTGPWTPPYRIPQADGEVVLIAGDAAVWSYGGGSEYETNVWADVAPAGAGSYVANGFISGGDSACVFLQHVSPGGAVGNALVGGHHGKNHFGGGFFDFTDARWKRVWTTQGNPGVDNITNEGPPPSEGGPPYVDIRSGTMVHGCGADANELNDDFHDFPVTVGDHYWDGTTAQKNTIGGGPVSVPSKSIIAHTPGAGHIFTLASAFSPNFLVGEKIYITGVTGTAASALNNLSHTITVVAGAVITTSKVTTGLTASGGSANGVPIAKWAIQCWNSDHWTQSVTAWNNAMNNTVPKTADPRDQQYEMTYMEATAWPFTGGTGQGSHGWLYPGEWNGDHHDAWPGRFTETGFVGQVPGGRFNPTPAGTVNARQSELPAPCHVWDMYFECSPAHGGGPKGSIVCSRHTYQGHTGVSNIWTSHAFDWHQGTWWRYSTNSSMGPNNPGGAGVTLPADMEGATAGAYDPVKDRYYLVGQRITKTAARINYLNLYDKTWRSMLVGGNPAADPTDRCEGLMVDPDRRLLVVSSNVAPYFHAFNLATVGPEPIPTAGTGGWWPLLYTNPQALSTQKMNQYWLAWIYYPPNGKYYRFMSRPLTTDMPNPGGSNPGDSTNSNWYHADTPAGKLNREYSKLQRLTPPPINAAAHAADPNYYVTSTNWMIDEITLSKPLSRGAWGYMYQSVGQKWFEYIPSIQRLAWIPCNEGGSGGEPITRYSVYLIKPF